MMRLKFPKQAGFREPANIKEVMDWIEELPADARPTALNAAMMTWNYAAGSIEEYNQYLDKLQEKELGHELRTLPESARE